MKINTNSLGKLFKVGLKKQSSVTKTHANYSYELGHT
jgi:hypothetical protein